jgi:hypothetical protein
MAGSFPSDNYLTRRISLRRIEQVKLGARLVQPTAVWELTSGAERIF